MVAIGVGLGAIRAALGSRADPGGSLGTEPDDDDDDDDDGIYCPSKESPLPVSHIPSPRCSEINTSIYRGPIEAISLTSSLS